MFYAARRPSGRLFYWLLLVGWTSIWLQAQTPTLTTVIAATSPPAWRRFIEDALSSQLSAVSFLPDPEPTTSDKPSLMNLRIDNFDGRGMFDYTAAVDGSQSRRVVRKLNQISTLRVSLVWDGADFVVPIVGAHVMLVRSNGQFVFTGYLIQAPAFEYLGWGERGPMYRYNLVAQSDEALLDEKRLPLNGALGAHFSN
jgi:hypothetical protein